MHKRRFLVVILASLISISVVRAQSAPAGFEKAKQSRNDALRSGDDTTYARYTSDKFMVIVLDGHSENKADAVARVAKIKSNPPAGGIQPAAKRRDEKFDVYNGDTVIENWTQDVANGREARFTEIWVKQKGNWTCAAAHASLVMAKP
jgi:hypothetical protein